MPETKCTILHISDLHIKPGEEFDRSVVLDPLLERVSRDRKEGIIPEIVVVSGDIAYKGIKEEYQFASAFFHDLRTTLELQPETFFIVPGNHDINRKKYRPTDIPVYNSMAECNNELEHYADDLLKGMADYFDFIKTVFPHLKTLKGSLIPFVQTCTTPCNKKIGLVGLNSAWMCRKSPDREEIALGEYQVKHAFSECEKLGETDLILCIFHHPLNWLWREDRNITRQYVNSKIVLAGHLHEPGGGFFQDLDGGFYQFQAGGAYLGSESDWPSRYQYITFDWAKKQVRLDFRKFVKQKRKWVLDAETGDDGVKRFPFLHIRENKKTVKQVITLPPVPDTYRTWITENYGYMDATNLYGKGEAYPLSLPEIFVPLYAHDPGKVQKGIKEALSPGSEYDFDRQKPANIETLMAESDLLLIQGDPGSGKTTLLKHFAYSVIQTGGKDIPDINLYNVLPILVLLKEMKAFFAQAGDKTGMSGEDILAWYNCSKMGGILSAGQLEQFLKAGKAIILLDGLDECESRYRDRVVDAFCNLRPKYKDTKVVITSRPHGITGSAVNKCSSNKISILPLDTDQVKLFINKWFTYFYPGSSGLGRKNAQAMIQEIQGHQAIGNLIPNPLMLTAVCILYHDGKELPEQRAELYKKFIDNMLYRRFPDPEEVHDFLKTLAFRMHTKNLKAVDKHIVISILGGKIKKKDDETDAEHKRRTEKHFDQLEPKCGLLRYDNGQYSFRHLTFQEFLTAQYMMDNYSDYIQAVRPFWEDEWYKEVVELFVSLISIEHKKTANDIILDAIKNDDAPPYKKWLTAGRAMLDIYYKRRDDGVLEKLKTSMFTIIKRQEEPVLFAQAGDIIGWLGDPRDLKEFVKVSGGSYKLEGLGTVTVKDFEIGKYPVTNAWFEEFVAAGGYENEAYWTEEGNKWRTHTKAVAPRFWDDRKWRCPNCPVVGICWYEAVAFTNWLTRTGKDGHTYRLPSEEEWQAAAAGKEGRTYPWGNDWNEKGCNNSEIISKPSAVGVFEKGDTPAGDKSLSSQISDLAGNVWEWTSSGYSEKEVLEDAVFLVKAQELYDEKKYVEAYDIYKGKNLPVLRGSSWYSEPDSCRCAYRLNGRPINWGHCVGFRCARA